MLEGEKVRLRGIEKEDVDVLHEYMNNPEVTRYLDDHYRPHSRREEEEFIEDIMDNMKEGNEYHFGIEEKESGDLVGVVSLNDIQGRNKSAELGICIREDSWNKGYGTEAEKLTVEYGFRELNLNSIHCRVFEFNERSKKVAKKVGFKEAGRLRKSIYRDGKYWDTIYLDILKKEFLEKL
ncbi:hypothetical protein AKJ65_01890 [candidate division MSBL1 archaeon SCGC-AAA259E19]|uniref:N-acetyltransferase domain-containing protein n=1 Tax=candidate division MSBL1 archaeon SCGC-AAA259E19 TaxID=1698264 RepID=A0A133UMK1_9EURY|nr:hypothetical protein AKJ65_01890 [candidate division MSBL1 archaeon SCGC-AAA259E19]